MRVVVLLAVDLLLALHRLLALAPAGGVAAVTRVAQRFVANAVVDASMLLQVAGKVNLLRLGCAQQISGLADRAILAAPEGIRAGWKVTFAV